MAGHCVRGPNDIGGRNKLRVTAFFEAALCAWMGGRWMRCALEATRLFFLGFEAEAIPLDGGGGIAERLVRGPGRGWQFEGEDVSARF
jgi:hypothetical protein